MSYLACFVVGYLISFMVYTRCNDAKYERICVQQQKRGDHWFSRYLQACDELEKHRLYLSNDDPKNFYNN